LALILPLPAGHGSPGASLGWLLGVLGHGASRGKLLSGPDGPCACFEQGLLKLLLPPLRQPLLGLPRPLQGARAVLRGGGLGRTHPGGQWRSSPCSPRRQHTTRARGRESRTVAAGAVAGAVAEAGGGTVTRVVDGAVGTAASTVASAAGEAVAGAAVNAAVAETVGFTMGPFTSRTMRKKRGVTVCTPMAPKTTNTRGWRPWRLRVLVEVFRELPQEVVDRLLGEVLHHAHCALDAEQPLAQSRRDEPDALMQSLKVRTPGACEGFQGPAEELPQQAQVRRGRLLAARQRHRRGAGAGLQSAGVP